MPCQAGIHRFPDGRITCRCGACKNLKRSFVETGDKLGAASKKYNMVAVNGDENNALGVGTCLAGMCFTIELRECLSGGIIQIVKSSRISGCASATSMCQLTP